MFLNFFSTSPRKSSIASASFAEASDGDPTAAAAAAADDVVVAVCGRDCDCTDILTV